MASLFDSFMMGMVALVGNGWSFLLESRFLVISPTLVATGLVVTPLVIPRITSQISFFFIILLLMLRAHFSSMPDLGTYFTRARYGRTLLALASVVTSFFN